ncbi:MAG: methylenetetrahydrofolate--tRNA-(uracil(54)-C(5))-methyltransferase (FADH(2)-oxidizing) TrmFO [Anaerolineales bacterium]|nr:methylenetetrahydrofolate--tRNA-(uracil(54)-C(5))-methyltransferase (FADH(2)-oxidizing) TrmFO [Anaerolineales bacterium]
MDTPEIKVVGGGLAGAEAAWQIAERGCRVALYEMRPVETTGAHTGDRLAELVCSNSLGSNMVDRASGLLKEELRRLDSLLIRCADQTSVPAGSALAVDREGFADLVTSRILAHPNIRLIREEVKEIPEGLTIIATGPLTSAALSESIGTAMGEEYLFFYDAISPIVSADSINFDIAYRASRYERGETESGDYINCPFTPEEYEAFTEALVSAERIQLKEFEKELEAGVRAGMHKFFEGCLPVEVLAQRDPRALAFGPMRPVGLDDPKTGRRPHAVVQLRQDNLSGSLFNLVGFQTNLKFSEQKRVFRMIPGLESAEFSRYGQMHRNTFIHSPALLEPTMQMKGRQELFFAGQITGVEGYVGNIASGWLSGVNAVRIHRSLPPLTMPETTMIGALCHYVSHAHSEDFQPMKANFGILPPLTDSIKRNRRQRAAAYSERALGDLKRLTVESDHSFRIAT